MVKDSKTKIFKNLKFKPTELGQVFNIENFL